MHQGLFYLNQTDLVWKHSNKQEECTATASVLEGKNTASVLFLPGCYQCFSSHQKKDKKRNRKHCTPMSVYELFIVFNFHPF